MTTLHCNRHGSHISLRLLPSQSQAVITSELIIDATKRGRALVWEQARVLSAQSSPWDIEYLKTNLGQPELLLGGSEALATKCESLTNGQTLKLSVTPQTLNLRSLRQALLRRGLRPLSGQLQAWADRGHFAIATALAIAMLIVYLVRFTQNNKRLPQMSGELVAVHGEWSNRTRHLLNQIGPKLAPRAILILGRPQTDLLALQKVWTSQLTVKLPPTVVPASAAAAWRALPKLLGQLRHGMTKVVSTNYRPTLREHSGVVFRVLLGGVMSQWWKDHGSPNGTILLGHTGTGDTVQLERAMQHKNSQTVHVVHGLCTGPNLVGFSNQAIFYCELDAKRYSTLQHYMRCTAPLASMLPLQRGEKGLLLLTNYAHPMNPGYQTRGLADELQVLRDTAELARAMGESAQPLQWKPHPAIQRLPKAEQDSLRAEAQSMGYVELAGQSGAIQAACAVRWALTTPSTVAIDLLLAGCLPIVLDLQKSASDDAIGHIPSYHTSMEEVRITLTNLTCSAAFASMYQTAWQRVGPAKAHIANSHHTQFLHH